MTHASNAAWQRSGGWRRRGWMAVTVVLSGAALSSCGSSDTLEQRAYTFETDAGGAGAGAPDNGAGDDGAAASDTASDGDDDGQTSGVPPSYYATIKPILDKNCVGCHSASGAAPFSLDTFEAAQPYAEQIMVVTEEGIMPPWPPDNSCRQYKDPRVLTDAEKQALRQWAEAEAPEGDPADEVPVEVQRIDFDPTLTAHMTEPYTPNPDLPDDYRCFELDATFDHDQFLIGTQVVPGAKKIVHHVLIYQVGQDSVEELEKLDAEDPGPGYTCFAGTGVSSFNPIGAWVPGMQPALQRSGNAIVIRKGSRLVMQVHYNTNNNPPEEDHTGYEMLLTDEAPERTVVTRPIPDLGIQIPAGDPASTHVKRYTNYSNKPVTIIGATGHMHLLGTSIAVEVEHASGENECLLNIPHWDFNWQQSYGFAGDDKVVVEPGDTIKMTCVYDNTSANQAVVNGTKLEPRDVEWGDKTTDEMCLSYITTVDDYVPPAERPPRCQGVPECREACDDPNSMDCILHCAAVDGSCTYCFAGGMYDCGQKDCLAEFYKGEDCFTDCAILPGDFASCMTKVCPGEYARLKRCMEPLFADGSCDEAFAACIP